VSEVARLQRDGSAVAMVGDGINDAAALAQADVGIAIGAGSHMAVEAADMVLMRNNLFDVIVALDLARCVFARVKWNFLWAFAYNVVAIPFAAGLWFPITHMLVFSTVCWTCNGVVLNFSCAVLAGPSTLSSTGAARFGSSKFL
jgi:Cu+-exporting ATPase